MVTKIVADTNIIVSAFGWDGPQRELFKLITKGSVILLISRPIFEELHRVVDYPRLRLSVATKNRILDHILELGRFVSVSSRIEISQDKDDDKFIECAVDGQADYIISGDKHLLNLGVYRGIKIITTIQFLAIFSTNAQPVG